MTASAHPTAHLWALVLAAGEGSRLRSLTTTADGTAIPKQFCSLRGGPSLMHEALLRAGAVAPPARTCVIVAREHRVWWQPALEHLPAQNVIVQPANRGTANGILLPILHILERDPDAIVALLPSDHHFADEATLRVALRNAVRQLERHHRGMILLGLEPEEVDPELGYIMPGLFDGAVQLVERFEEKPTLARTREAIAQGALCNAFILAARATDLVDLFADLYLELLARMQSAVAHDSYEHELGRTSAIDRLYERLPVIDFSRDVLQERPERLRVLKVAPCGWSDLGTPARVARTLSREHPHRHEDAIPGFHHVLNLSEQHGLLRASG